jgi:uncharacterized membrane protein YqjE
MTDYPNQPSTFGMLRTLADDVLGLFRKEVELAKAEASEAADKMIGALELLVIAAVLLIGAIGVLLGALVGLIATFLIEQGMHDKPASTIAAGVVGVILVVVAWIMLSRALNNLKLRNLALPKTRDALGRDAELVKEKI